MSIKSNDLLQNIQTSSQAMGGDLSDIRSNVLSLAGSSSVIQNSLLTVQTASQAMGGDLSDVRSNVVALVGSSSSIRDGLSDVQSTLESMAPSFSLATGTLSAQLQQVTVALRSDVQTGHNSTQMMLMKQEKELQEIRRIVASLTVTTADSIRDHQPSAVCFCCVPDVVRSYYHAEAADLCAIKVPVEQTLGRLLAKPSNLRTLCDEFDVGNLAVSPRRQSQQIVGASASSSMVLTEYSGSLARCFCRPRRHFSRRQTQWGPFQVYREDDVRNAHLPDCEMSSFVPRNGRYSLNLEFAGLRHLLKKAVGVSLSISFGAGGSSLGQNLTVRNTVDSNTAPAFQILDTLEQALFHTNGEGRRLLWPEFIKLAIGKLVECFREGCAMPTDFDDFNETPMHYVANLVRHPDP